MTMVPVLSQAMTTRRTQDIITQKADFYTYTQCSIHAGIKSLHLITA